MTAKHAQRSIWMIAVAGVLAIVLLAYFRIGW